MLDIIIRKDGDSYMAIRSDFTDLQNSPSYWGTDPLEALTNLLLAETMANHSVKIKKVTK